MTPRPWFRLHLGGIASSIDSWFRCLKESHSSKAKLQRQVEAACALVDVYSRLLEENTGMLIPASRLPADKNVFKRALKIAATADMVAGRLDDINGRIKRRDAYIMGYARLAQFVPDDLAERINRFYDSFLHARDLGDVDGRTLAEAIVDPGDGDLERQAETTTEYGRLADEFKGFLAEAEAGMSGRAGAPSAAGDVHLTRRAPLENIFPRWKACVLLFLGLTTATVFVPDWLAWAVFSLASGFICWRGYRDPPRIPAWVDAIRCGLTGVVIGAVLLVLAASLQLNGLVRLSRDIQIASPEWFLCCLWNGKSPKGDR